MKRRDLKIVFSSNGCFTNSGYGVFSRDILCRMIEDGWNVKHIAWWGLEGYPVELDLGQFSKRFKGLKLPVYPRMEDVWGGDALVRQSNEVDVSFTMQDIWTLNPAYLQQVKRWIPYVPIDKSPAPNLVTQRFPYAYRIVTFSQFGHDELAKAGYASTLILEGIDTKIFKKQDRNKARAKFKIPHNAFVFGMVAANKENPPRKGYAEALEAFSIFVKSHPEAKLFIHTQQRSPTGFPIVAYARHLDIEKHIIFPDDFLAVYGSDSYVIREEMSAFDVLLHPSQTEGFGLTPVEAMSVGTPVIVANNTSQPELIIDGKTGWICDIGHKRFTADNSYVEEANVQSLVSKMEEAYKTLNSKNTIAKDCREHVINKYNIDTIYKEKWSPFLERIQKEILPVDKVK